MRTALLALTLALGGTALTHLPAGAQPPGVPREVKVFKLKNADAQRLRETLLTIFGRQGITVAVDARTNSLVISADTDTMEEARKLIAKLDEK